jgi:hypothetical protein
MRDGAPPHFHGIVRQHLNKTFGEQLIGLGGPVSLPEPSRDLDPLEFLLWGQIKTLLYSAVISDIQV